MPKPIKLTKTDTVRFWSKVDKCGPDDCWKWQASCNHARGGYGQFRIGDFMARAHRVAYVIANSNTNLLVLHTCDHPWCCNPAHLYAGTQKRNKQDCIDRGRAINVYGENCGRAKLTESDVCEICALYAGGWVQHKIAKDYGITQQQVSRICRGEQWQHI